MSDSVLFIIQSLMRCSASMIQYNHSLLVHDGLSIEVIHTYMMMPGCQQQAAYHEAIVAEPGIRGKSWHGTIV